MHKYQPRVHIVRKRDHTASVVDLHSKEAKTFEFPETSFIAVTAYQNQLVSRQCQWGCRIFLTVLSNAGTPAINLISVVANSLTVGLGLF